MGAFAGANAAVQHLDAAAVRGCAAFETAAEGFDGIEVRFVDQKSEFTVSVPEKVIRDVHARRRVVAAYVIDLADRH